MVNIIKEQLPIEEDLMKKLNIICDFAGVKPKFINGCIRQIENTNLTYIEPHRLIVNNKTYLIFNYSYEVFIENLSNMIKISEFEEYLKNS